jgi:hypothetical protein
MRWMEGGGGATAPTEAKGLALGPPVGAGWFCRQNAGGQNHRERRCLYAFLRGRESNATLSSSSISSSLTVLPCHLFDRDATASPHPTASLAPSPVSSRAATTGTIMGQGHKGQIAISRCRSRTTSLKKSVLTSLDNRTPTMAAGKFSPSFLGRKRPSSDCTLNC